MSAYYVSDELENLRRYIERIAAYTLLIKRLIPDIRSGSLVTMKQLMGMSGLGCPEIIKAIESKPLPKPLPLGPWNFGWDEKVQKNGC